MSSYEVKGIDGDYAKFQAMSISAVSFMLSRHFSPEIEAFCW